MGQKRKRVEDVNFEQNDIGSVESERSSEKRTRLEVNETETLAPLTEENLTELQSNLSAAEVSESFATMGRSEKQRLMEDFGLEVDAPQALAQFSKGFKTTANKIVELDRYSPVREDDEMKWVMQRKKYEARTEKTFIHYMWKMIVHDERTIKDTEDHARVEHPNLTTKTWEEDNLDSNWDAPFTKNFLPPPDTSKDPQRADLLRREQNIPNPEPDAVYGLDPQAFGDKKIIVRRLDSHIGELSRDLSFPFFPIQFKTISGSLEDAELQACRDGGAILYYTRMFKDMAGILDEEHAQDDCSFVFSLAVSPKVARLFVHWATEPTGDSAVYHMHSIRTYTLSDPPSYTQLHHDVHNVLEWGVGRRRNYINDHLDAVSDYLDSHPKPKKQKMSSSKKSSAAKESMDMD